MELTRGQQKQMSQKNSTKCIVCPLGPQAMNVRSVQRSADERRINRRRVCHIPSHNHNTKVSATELCSGPGLLKHARSVVAGRFQ